MRGLNTLQKLYCSENELTSLEIQDLKTLQKLNCYKNKLTSLNVQGLTALQWLNCGYNELTTLNLKGLHALRDLECFKNNLPELDVQDINTLQRLNCYHNKLSTLELSTLHGLQELCCYDNLFNEKNLIRILTALPDRKQKKEGRALIYGKKNDPREGTITDFSSSAELKAAFEAAKAKNWRFYKRDTIGNEEEDRPFPPQPSFERL